MPELDAAYPNWLKFILNGGGEPKHLDCDACDVCPRQPSQKKPVSPVFSSWQDYISFKAEHMCSQHGPLGANTVLMHVPEWIDKYL